LLEVIDIDEWYRSMKLIFIAFTEEATFAAAAAIICGCD
jgi:hypothetical protein